MGIYFYGCITLDGYLADARHGLGWLDGTGSVEETSFDSFYKEMDITLMRRRTFRAVEALGDPAGVYPSTENYVFTHQRQPLPEGFQKASGSVVDFVTLLPRGKNVWVVGGNTLLAPLLDCGLVDHLIVQVAPVLLGRGVPLFTQKEAQTRFRLDGLAQYGQFAELRYSRL